MAIGIFCQIVYSLQFNPLEYKSDLLLIILQLYQNSLEELAYWHDVVIS